MTDPVATPEPPVPLSAKPVALVNRVGEIEAVSPEQVDAALKSGYRPATAEEWQGEVGRIEAQRYEAGKEAQFGGLRGALGAYAQGLARAGTFGLSDAAYKALSGNPEQAAALLKASREQNPSAELAGQITGYVLPTPAGKALGVVGKAAETGAARLVGTGATSLIGKVAQGAATLGARGAAEGAVLGAQSELTEETLGNEKINAEKLLASGAKGALAGGLTLGALGGASPVVRASARALAESAMKGVGGKGETLSEIFTSLKNNSVFKTLGGDTASAVRKAERVEGGAQRVASDITEQLEKSGVKSWAKMGPEEIAQKVEERISKVGDELGQMRRSLDALSEKTGIRPDVAGLRDQVYREVIQPLDRLPGTENTQRKVAKFFDDFFTKKLENQPSASFSDMEAFREGLRSKIKWSARAGDEANDAFKALSRVVEDQYEGTAERAAKAAGESFSAKHQELKRAYTSLKIADDLVREKLVREAGRAAVGLSDYAAAAAGAAAAGPIGLTAGLARKVLRDKGHEIMAEVYGKLAKLTEIQNRVQAFDVKLEKGVQNYIKGQAISRSVTPTSASSGVFATRRGEGKYEPVRRAVERVAELAANQAAMTNHTAMQTQHLAMHAPKTSMAMAGASARAVQYLHENAPRDQGNARSVQPQLQKPVYSDTEVAAYARRVSAVENPLSLLDEMRHNRLTPEAVDAVKHVYPEIFAQMQSKVQEIVSQAKEKIPYDKIVQMSVLFQTPLDGTMEPKFIQSVQTAFAQPKTSPQGRAPASAARQANKVASMMKTPAEQLATERP